MIRLKQIRPRKVPRADIVVLNLHLSPFVEDCVHGFNYLSLDLKNPIIYFDLRFLSALVRANRKVSRLAAWIIAVTQASGSHVILTMDNFDTNNHHGGSATLLEEISTVCEGIHLLSIQHGQELRRLIPTSSTKDVTLLCWGDWVRDNFPRFGRKEAKYVTVGALVNDQYLRVRPTVSKQNQLLIISTVKDETWWGDGGGERQYGYGTLIDYIKRYCATQNIRPIVALTIDRDHDPTVNEAQLEREWFTKRFGGDIQFSEPRSLFGSGGPLGFPARAPRYTKERYATYFLSDCSEVTIGMSSTVLWESFARGNKILSVNPTDNETYNFPVDGPWSLQKPSYEEFSSRLEWLLQLEADQWEAISRDPRGYLVDLSEPGSVSGRISEEIQKCIDLNLKADTTDFFKVGECDY